jgi:hypothetical protein
MRLAVEGATTSYVRKKCDGYTNKCFPLVHFTQKIKHTFVSIKAVTGGGEEMLEEDEETNVYTSATAHMPILMGKLATEPILKNASCKPAKTVSSRTTAPVTSQPATYCLARLPLIILAELMRISVPRL